MRALPKLGSMRLIPEASLTRGVRSFVDQSIGCLGSGLGGHANINVVWTIKNDRAVNRAYLARLVVNFLVGHFLQTRRLVRCSRENAASAPISPRLLDAIEQRLW